MKATMSRPQPVGGPPSSGVCRVWLVAALAALAACGGGGETKTGSNGTGIAPPLQEVLAAAGPINALGPTGIGSITFDDSAADVLINAGTRRPVSELRLGMFIEAAGTTLTNGASGTASSVTSQSLLVGPVSAVNVNAHTLTVLSQQVQIDQNTILDGVASVASLGIGARIEVHGLNQPPAAGIRATRLIALPALPASATATIEVLGAATSVTETALTVAGLRVATGNAQIIVGGQPLVLPSPRPPVSALSENNRVRVIGTLDPATNTVIATQVIAGLNPVRNDNSVIVLDGLVQSVSAPGRFRLNDTDVDATATGGNTVAVGNRVQVTGRKTQGTLVATQFKVASVAERVDYIIQGPITEFASIAAFRVRGELIDASSATFTGGTAVELAALRRVQVKAQAGPGTLTARQVSFLP